MANLTIRNLDDEVVDILKRRARRNNRSLEAELREVLTRVAQGASPAGLRVEAARIAGDDPPCAPTRRRPADPRGP